MVVHQRANYTRDIHYNIPSNWVIHNSPSGQCIVAVGINPCADLLLNPQVLFYDVHDSYFDDKALDILCKHKIQYFILESGDFVYDQPNNNVPNMNFNHLYGNAIMNWIRQHGTLEFTPAHINYVLVETWESFKLSSATIT